MTYRQAKRQCQGLRLILALMLIGYKVLMPSKIIIAWLEKRRFALAILRTEIIDAVIRTSMSAIIGDESPDQSDDAKKVFEKDKTELTTLIKQLLKDYPGIPFDEEMKSRIFNWEYGKVPNEKILEWTEKILEYIVSLKEC